MKKDISLEESDIVSKWSSLLRNKGWKILVELFKIKARELNVDIYKIGGDSEKKYSERDFAIMQKQFIIEMINTPKDEIDSINGVVEGSTENFDAFSEIDEEEDFGYNRDKQI